MRFRKILLVVLVFILFLVIHTLYVAGVFKTITPHLEGTIVNTWYGIHGAEDMDADEAAGWVFISSADRWKTLSGLESNDGIYLLQPDSNTAPRKLPTTYTGGFHPHGISYLRSGDSAYLFVVNHNRGGDFVELFAFDRDTLFHLQSIADRMMCCPNDVVAIASDKFYVTNDHGNGSGFVRTLEDYLQLPFASLLYYNGGGFTKVVTGLKYANGVNVSANGERLYLTTTTGRNLLSYDRDTTTGALQFAHKMNLKSGVDNIDVDTEGNLWIAAHPKLLAFTGHARDSGKLSPSQVLKLLPANGGGYTVEEIWMDDGQTLSGSSIALRYKNHLFVGGVFQPKVVKIGLKK
jgi:arylesterase / paraoxonase